MAKRPVTEAVPIIGSGLGCSVCSRDIYAIEPGGNIPCGWVFKSILLPSGDTTWFAICGRCADANDLLEDV